MAKKLIGNEAVLFKNLLNKKHNTVVEIESNLYLIQPLEGDDMQKEIESDPELMKMIERADKDIAAGNLYTTDEIIEAIERVEI